MLTPLSGGSLAFLSTALYCISLTLPKSCTDMSLRPGNVVVALLSFLLHILTKLSKTSSDCGGKCNGSNSAKCLYFIMFDLSRQEMPIKLYASLCVKAGSFWGRFAEVLRRNTMLIDLPSPLTFSTLF